MHVAEVFLEQGVDLGSGEVVKLDAHGGSPALT
jgi:hypothetical protein